MPRSRHHTKLMTLRSALPPFAYEPGLACTNPANDPDLWHSRNEGAVGKAQALCRDCPFVDECATWAIETRQQHGVWGATSARERERLTAAARA